MASMHSRLSRSTILSSSLSLSSSSGSVSSFVIGGMISDGDEVQSSQSYLYVSVIIGW